MDVLIGRDRELGALDHLIDHINEQGAAVLVRGALGIGKSALLLAAREHAWTRGMRTLYAIGVQSETHLPFAGLHQLLHPLLDDAADLPAPQRDALLAAFGMTTAGQGPDLFLISLAALNLLSNAASRSSLFVLVDDVHWVDRSTSEVLAFIARRIESDPILLLCALRDSLTSVLTDAGLTEIYLDGLEEAAAAALLDAQSVRLEPAIRTRLLQNAAGHPLAIIELAKALRAEGYDGEAPLPAWLPLTARLERAFSARASLLPPVTRALLLIAATNDSDSLVEALQATGVFLDRAAVSEAALQPAIDAELITLDGAALHFRHPLMRSALYQSAGDVQRRAAHIGLAAILGDNPDRAVWHRAAAVIATDEQVAADLAEAAERALHRGDIAVAVAAYERAAQVSDDDTRRGEWLLRAITYAIDYDVEVARRILRATEQLNLQPQQHAEVVWLRETIAEEGQWTGAAHVRRFVEMADQAALIGDVERALYYLFEIALRSFWSNPDEETRALVVASAVRLSLPDDHPTLIFILATTSPIECEATVLDRMSRLPLDGGDAMSAFLLGGAATAVGAFERAAQFLGAAIASLRQQGRLQMVAQALVSQALATRYTGNWSVAIPAAEEASRLAQETAQPLWMAAAQAIGAMADGLRGEVDRAEACAAAAEREIRIASANPMLALVQLARGAIALTAGRHAEAFEQLRRVFDPADIAYHPVVRCWAIGDLVEAAVYSGHLEQARAVVEELEEIASRSSFPVLLAGLHLARPFLAEDESKEAAFLAGLGADLTDLALARERLQLAYGAWLRRHQRPMESRAPLRAARDGFDALGAAPWGERARQELRASGETSRRHELRATEQLTPQELQIALLAAEGLSNREIGERLYLSHRTVGFHLYRVFPKLGVTSRAELAAALHATLGAERRAE